MNLGRIAAAAGRRARGWWLPVACLLLAAPAGAQIVTELAELEFGTIAVGQNSGVVALPPTGAAQCGPHTCLGGQQSARYQIQGLPLTTYSITFSNGDQLDLQGGGGSVPLQNLRATGNDSVTTGLLGAGTFRVGGDLVLGPTTPGGSYSGTFEVTVDLP